MIRPYAFAILVVAASTFAAERPDQEAHFADADNHTLVLEGQRIYRENCAQCHGRNLQGQALWRLQDEYFGRRAPAHDGTGHSWQHSDEALFVMVRDGRFLAAPLAGVSSMPAFRERLDSDQILAVLAFIKSRWGTGLRIAQSSLNPGFRGMPEGGEALDWTLPPTCSSTQQRWRVQSR